MKHLLHSRRANFVTALAALPVDAELLGVHALAVLVIPALGVLGGA